MSKENNNLRLLGSPVNLSYRSKKKDDRKNIRNRPRSAHQSSCFTPENHERFQRPFSADTKERVPSTRSFLKTFSTDLLQSYNNSSTYVKIFPPTTELLGKPCENHTVSRNKEMCSNASDYGSEDTFISLGTKIKTKAQTTKNKNIKAVKYRNIVKRGRKVEEVANNDKADHNYGLEITITERAQSPCKDKNVFHHRSASPTIKNKTHESYFVAFNDNNKCNDNVSMHKLYDTDNQYDIEKSIDTYSNKLKLTKQQLSLVEEESMQDLEGIPSNDLNNLLPETLINVKQVNKPEQFPGFNSFSHIEKPDESCEQIRNTQEFTNESRTYRSFYDDFNRNNDDLFKTNLSSTFIHTDSSSKDSGYPDSVLKEETTYSQNFSLPSTTVLKKSNSYNKLEDQPKSLDSSSTVSNDKDYRNTYPLDKKCTEPLNHSRLLYKDFFLKKEGHLALPPQNSPDRPDPSKKTDRTYTGLEVNEENKDFDYPRYLINSSAKAYTSKVIEDYKKEIDAINNLHELTLKDIKTDAISPTPLNIDVIFENNNQFEDKCESIESSQKSSDISNTNVKDKNSLHNNKSDISKITTTELIRNYFKVKHDYPKGVKENVIKNIRKIEKKISNCKHDDKGPGPKLDCKASKSTITKSVPDNIKRQSPKNIFTSKIPLSARIESVQNDKDIDSWMSLTIPSPRVIDVDNTNRAENTEGVSKVETPAPCEIESEKGVKPLPQNDDPVDESSKPKELDSKSTVLDIYSMLKEIESYGDNPVTSVSDVNITEKEIVKEEERAFTPKDNFMEIFEFLEKVEQSANDALSIVTNSTPQATPKLEVLLKLPHTELAQRLVTASLQLEERSCCIALLQESLTNHKQRMITKVNNLEKQSQRHAMKVKQECEEAIKRHQNFIDQLINDKKTLNHRIEQLVDERRSMEERWKRSVQTLEERYKLELRNQHDKMAAAQQVARQRWVKQKAEKIKELTVKGLESELREMAERQQKEISDLKMTHAEQMGRAQAKHASELEELRRRMEDEKENALIKERQMASSRLEKQILEIELTYQEQRTRLVNEMRAESERAAEQLSEREREQRSSVEKWKEEQEKLLEKKRAELAAEIAAEKARVEEVLQQKRNELAEDFERHKREFEAEQQMVLKRKMTEIAAQHKLERDREIEKAIESMETEAQAGRKELQEALRRNKEQFEIELKELAETEQATLRRYQDAQARVRQTEDRCAELEVTIGQLETRNKVLTEKNIQLETQIEDARKSCDEAWRCKVETLNKEMDELKKIHDEQMHQLYAKVKVAVARKDSAIQALTREAAKYQEKITLLEQKLQQQRKDFLKQK